MAFPVVPVFVALYFAYRALTGKDITFVGGTVSRAYAAVLRGFGLLAAVGLLSSKQFAWGSGLMLLSLPPLWLATCCFRVGAFRLGAWVAFICQPLFWRRPTRQLGLFCRIVGGLRHPQGRLFVGAKRRAALLSGDLYGGGVAAGALVALERQDLETARALFEAVRGMSSSLASPWLRGFAADFLLADAAERGNWQEVLVRARLKPRTPTSRVFEFAASTLLAEVPPRRSWRLRLALLQSPRRAAARLLCQWATAERRGLDHAQSSAAAAAAAAGVRTGASTSPMALVWTLNTSPPGSLSPETLCGFARSMEGAWGEGVLGKRLTQRLAELAAQGTAEELLAQLLTEAKVQLGLHLQANWAPAERFAEGGELLLDDCRATMMSELERLRDAFCERDDPARRVAGLAAWTVWGKLCIMFEQVWAISPEWRYGLFDELGTDLNNTAVDLLNEEKERTLAHQVFGYLFARRQYCRDEEIFQLLKQNRKVSGV